jgi:hypothetical protein
MPMILVVRCGRDIIIPGAIKVVAVREIETVVGQSFEMRRIIRIGYMQAGRNLRGCFFFVLLTIDKPSKQRIKLRIIALMSEQAASWSAAATTAAACHRDVRSHADAAARPVKHMRGCGGVARPGGTQPHTDGERVRASGVPRGQEVHSHIHTHIHTHIHSRARCTRQGEVWKPLLVLLFLLRSRYQLRRRIFQQQGSIDVHVEQGRPPPGDQGTTRWELLLLLLLLLLGLGLGLGLWGHEIIRKTGWWKGLGDLMMLLLLLLLLLVLLLQQVLLLKTSQLCFVLALQTKQLLLLLLLQQ